MDDVGDGPFVAAAFFCERVLKEQDGVVSAIRVIDVHTIALAGDEAPDELPEGFIFAAKLVLILKSGSAKGRHQIRIEVESPSGQTSPLPPLSIPAMFEGGEKGVLLDLDVQLPVEHEGLYWFDVTLNQRLLTRVPLRIVYSPMRIG